MPQMIIISYKEDASFHCRGWERERFGSQFKMKRVNSEEEAIDHIFRLDMAVMHEAGEYDHYVYTQDQLFPPPREDWQDMVDGEFTDYLHSGGNLPNEWRAKVNALLDEAKESEKKREMERRRQDELRRLEEEKQSELKLLERLKTKYEGGK